jgi:hypothetical protein
MSASTSEPHIEDVMFFMGIQRGKYKEASYENWRRFLALLRLHSGESEERFLHLARSYVGVGDRYLREYLNACKEWAPRTQKTGNSSTWASPKVPKWRKANPTLQMKSHRGGESHAPNVAKSDPSQKTTIASSQSSSPFHRGKASTNPESHIEFYAARETSYHKANRLSRKTVSETNSTLHRSAQQATPKAKSPSRVDSTSWQQIPLRGNCAA